MNCIKCKVELLPESIYCHMCGKKQVTTKQRRARHSNGSGTVRKLQGKRKKPWEAYTPAFWNGIKYERIRIGTFETERLAREAIAKVSPRALKDTYSFTVEDAYEAWKGPHFATIGVKGIEGYETSWRYIEPLYKRKMRDIRTQDLQNIIDDAVEAGKSRSLCEKIKQLESQLCKWAVDNDVLPRNMAERVKLPRVEEKEKRILTDDEILQIESLVNDPTHGRIAKIVMVLTYTGLRVSGLTTLKVEDVHLDDGYMVGGVKTEQGRRRVIPIHTRIRPIIQGWQDTRPPVDFVGKSQYLIPASSGKPLMVQNIRRELNAMLDSLEISGVSFHSCRHTYITKHARAGTRPEVLSRLAGHTDYDITMIYTHNTELEELIAANESIV